MALKPCRECKKKVSTEASTCPSCGVPNPTIIKEKTIDTFKNVNMHCPDIHCDEYRIVKSSPAGKTSYKCEKCNYELTDSKKLLSKRAKEIKKVSVDNNNPPTISEAALFNLIKKIWDGNEDLVKAFWIYFIVISNVVWFIGGFLYGALNARWILIFPLAVMIITAGGAWNSSTKYKNKKLKEKKGYGWAIATKVVVILGFLYLAGNFADLFK